MKDTQVELEFAGSSPCYLFVDIKNTYDMSSNIFTLEFDRIEAAHKAISIFKEKLGDVPQNVFLIIPKQ